MRRIADFLGITLTPAQWAAALEHTSFEYMRAHGERTVPAGGAIFNGGANAFLHKGQAGRWRELLTDADSAAYEARVAQELEPACARWLEQGGEPV